MANQAAARAPGAGPFPPALRRSIGVIMIGSALSFLDSTIVNVALRSLSVSLHAPLAQVQWVVTGYLLALAAVIPVTGWATRRAGPSRLYIGAMPPPRSRSPSSAPAPPTCCSAWPWCSAAPGSACP